MTNEAHKPCPDAVLLALQEQLAADADPARRMGLIDDVLCPLEPQLLDTCILQNLDWVDRQLNAKGSILWDDVATAELVRQYGTDLAHDLIDLGILYKRFEHYSGYPWLVCDAAVEEAGLLQSIGTLAELAVFQELTGGKDDEATSGLLRPTLREFNRVERSAETVLQEAGISARRASAFSALAHLVRTAGLILVVRGMAARLVVEPWANAIGRGILVDATIGLVDDSPLRQYLSGSERPEVVAILDANLSALDIYARPISDAVVAALLEKDNVSKTTVFLSITESVGRLPVPQAFQRISIAIDLDSNYTFDTEDIDDALIKAFDPDDGVLTKRLWKPAASRIEQSVKSLDPGMQRLVLPLLLDDARFT